MGLSGSAAVLRKPARLLRARGAGLDEDWTLVLLGVAVLLVTIGLAVLAAWTVHQRDGALRDATAAGQRLNIGGADSRLYQDLVVMQQDEVTLFQKRVDPGQEFGPGQKSGNNPATDLTRVQDDLGALKAQFGSSVQVQRDLSLITQEMAYYTQVEANALTDNQRGLPVGAGYLREASRYLTLYMLPAADDIRQVDQARVGADDSAAAGLPWPLLAVAVLSLACLAGAQLLTARYTRCLFDPWLLLSTAATTLVIVWSVTAVSVSLHEVASDTSPHAVAAADLAQARVDAVQAHNDDLLTLTDNGEDCSASGPPSYYVTCSFEKQVVDSLTTPTGRPKGRLQADLALAARDAPDQLALSPAGAASADLTQWRSHELALPTLQNLATQVTQVHPSPPRDNCPFPEVPRDNCAFQQVLARYASPDPQRDSKQVSADYTAFEQVVRTSIGNEWASYDRQSGGASGALTGAVAGALLLGLLAAVAGGLGIGLRVAEYWMPGGSAA